MARKILFGILAGFCIIIVVVLAAKNLIITQAAKSLIHEMTGLSLSVDKLEVGLLRPAIEIRSLVIRNPEGFTEPTMLDLPQLSVTYDPAAFLKRSVHIPHLTIELKEFNVVKNKQGSVNLDSLQGLQKPKPASAAPAAKPSGEKSDVAITIDRLDLAIGTVRYIDYTAKANPSVKEFRVNINRTYENITDPRMLVSTIVAQALMNTTIANLSGIKLEAIKDQAVGTLQETTKGLKLDKLLPFKK